MNCKLMRVLAYTVLWLLAMAFLSSLAVGIDGGAVRAQTPTPTPIPNYPAGTYWVTLDCGTGVHSVDATVTFTKDGTPKGSVTLHCPPAAKAPITLSSDWNDLEVAFSCDLTPVPTPTPTATPAATVQVPSGRVMLQHLYYLACSYPGPGTPTPTPGPASPYVIAVSFVGGIAEPADLDGSAANLAEESGGLSSGAYAAMIGGTAAALLALSAGVVYARRRWLK